MQTIESPLGPLQYCNIDEANYKLRLGMASLDHARAYVAMWNKPGMRFTIARLQDRLVNVTGVPLLAPYITIH
jgi:hypothetical protein